MYKDKDWIKTLHNIVEKGWRAKVTVGYLKKLRELIAKSIELEALRAGNL